LSDVALAAAVLDQRLVRPAEDVDEAGSDREPSRVDLLGGSIRPSDGQNAITDDGDVGLPRCTAFAVVDRSSADDELRVGHGYIVAVSADLAPSEGWPEPVQRVSAFLKEAAAEARLEEFPVSAHTARAAADAVGCDLQRIVKSIVFEADGRAIVAMVPGDRRADAGKIATAVGAAAARTAGPDQVQAATGFAPGAVAPFPHRRVDRVLIERTLLAHEIVWIGAGSDRHMAGLAPAELIRLSRAEPVDIVQDN
jgi:Cys-tRNA(Pro) deacylase